MGQVLYAEYTTKINCKICKETFTEEFLNKTSACDVCIRSTKGKFNFLKPFFLQLSYLLINTPLLLFANKTILKSGIYIGIIGFIVLAFINTNMFFLRKKYQKQLDDEIRKLLKNSLRR